MLDHVAWASVQNTGDPVAKLMLIALAERADDEGRGAIWRKELEARAEAQDFDAFTNGLRRLWESGLCRITFDDEGRSEFLGTFELIRRDPSMPRPLSFATIKRYVAYLYSDPCVYCGARAEHIDHIDARANGGGNGADNLTAACRRCNTAKGTKTLLTFLLDRAVLA